MDEWESCVLLDQCLSKWRKMIPPDCESTISSLHILSFNVRGIGLRWQEVVLLSTSLTSDIIILLETGHVEFSFLVKIFNSFSLFYQAGENKHGGVLILVRKMLPVSRIECKIPNVCVLDVCGEETLRIIGVYAPSSKSWS